MEIIDSSWQNLRLPRAQKILQNNSALLKRVKYVTRIWNKLQKY